MSASSDVLIVGGGVIGLTTAYFLAKEGVRVEVLDRGQLGAEASWAGAGIIPPGNPEHAATSYDRLRATSSRMFAGLSAELCEATGCDNGYRVCGGIEFLDSDDRETLPAWRSEGIEFSAVGDVSSIEPAVDLKGGQAYLVPGMAQVRNPRHVRMLIEACVRREVQLFPNTPIASIERHCSTIHGLRLASGEVRSAGQYLIAAGAWSASLLESLGIKSGIHPVRGQIVLLKSTPRLLRRILLAGKNYLVPREDGHVLIGATEEPEAGFEKQTTAEAIAGLIAFGTSLVPQLAKAEFVKCWAGLRPGSLDGLPSMGSVGEFKNLFLAGGHFRAGIQLSPATGSIMCELLMGRQPSIALGDFRPGREPGPYLRSAFRS